MMSTKLRATRNAAILVVMLVSTIHGQNAWEEYTFHRKLSVTNLAAIGASLTDFPVLVKLTPRDYHYFQHSRPDGHDVVFTAADGITVLDFEREKHDALVGEAIYWVRLPVVSDSAPTDFHLHYGAENAVDTSNFTAVWDDDFMFVHHLAEANGAAFIYDSTTNLVTGTVLGKIKQGRTGYIGEAAEFANGTEITLANLDRPENATIEFWFKVDALNAGHFFQAEKVGTSSCYGIKINSLGQIESSIHAGGGWLYNTGVTQLDTNTWHYVVDIFGAQGRKIYVDGVLDGDTENTGIPYKNYWDLMSIGRSIVGFMDETRMSRTVRSPDWIKAQNASMRDQLLSYGPVTGKLKRQWPAGYVFRRRLTVTNTAAITANMADFPVAVRFSADNFRFRGGDAAGQGVLFTDFDGITPLSYECERYDSKSGQALYWVKLPSLLSYVPETSFYVYYGSSAINDAYDPAAVWDDDFIFVHHLAATNGAPLVHDSSANAIDGTISGKVTLDTEGYLGAGAMFASGTKIDLADFERPAKATLEFWFKANTLGTGKFFQSLKSGVSVSYEVTIGSDGRVKSWLHTGGSTPTNSGDSQLDTDTWYYVVDIFGNEGRKIYIDGVLDGSSANTGVPRDVWWITKSIGDGIPSYMDEVRMSGSVRSSGWVKAQNASMRGQLLSYGSEEGQSPGSMILLR